MFGHEVVDRLLQFRAPDPTVLSVYVTLPTDPGQLKGVHAQFEDVVEPVRRLVESHELTHAQQQSLRADVERVLQIAERGAELQGQAIAAFACHQADLFEELALPRRVRERAVVDVTPYTRPLLAVLDEARRYCVVVVDREHAWIFAFYMGELRGMRRLRGRVLRKPDYAGWHGLDEHRVRNRAGEMARRHFRETVGTVEDFMAETGTELLVVGGHEETVAQFLPLLPQTLQSRLAGTFAIDPRTMTPGHLREQTEAIIDRYEREEETRLVNEALERVAAGGLGASGLEWCLVAVNEQAVQLLLVNDDDQAPGKACDNCGWLGLTGDECPVCGRRTRATPDVIDEMAEAVVDASGRVEHVYAETGLAREHVAALLRFPVPKLVAAG